MAFNVFFMFFCNFADDNHAQQLRKMYLSNSKDMKQRLDYIDIAKGLGILTVIYSHSGGENGLMAYIGGFFIPLFFILSGYTMKETDNQSFMMFLKKKGQRLLLPYFIFSIVLLIVYRTFLFTDYIGVLYSRYCFYLFGSEENIYFMRGGNAPLWFLTSMFTSYLSFWCLVKTRKYTPYTIVLFILLTYCLDLLPFLLPWSMDVAFLMAVFIWIGTWLKKKDMGVCCWWHFLFLVVFYAVLCTLNGEPNLSVRLYGRSILILLVTGTIGTILIIKLSQKIEHTFLKNSLVELGRHSLVVFCIQMILLRIQNEVIFNILLVPLNCYTVYVTSFLKTIVVAVVGTYISKALRSMFPGVF